MFDWIKRVDELENWLRKSKVVFNNFNWWCDFIHISLGHFMKNFSSFVFLKNRRLNFISCLMFGSLKDAFSIVCLLLINSMRLDFCIDEFRMRSHWLEIFHYLTSLSFLNNLDQFLSHCRFSKMILNPSCTFLNFKFIKKWESGRFHWINTSLLSHLTDLVFVWKNRKV